MIFTLSSPDIAFILTGALVGLCVGLTGVGGGSLMTPLLTMLGIPLQTAIGTDLLYAAISKTGGSVVHARYKNINWRIVVTLAIGSLPAALFTVWGLKHLFPDAKSYKHLLTTTLGFMILVTSLTLLLRPWIQKRLQDAAAHRAASGDDSVTLRDRINRHSTTATVVMGVALGVLVTLSSVGAGAFGVMILVALYPKLPMIRIIGSDVAHAVALTLVAGLGHLSMGNVNWHLLFILLIGSLPMIMLGTRWSSHMPEHVIRPLLGITLFLLSLKFILA